MNKDQTKQLPQQSASPRWWIAPALALLIGLSPEGAIAKESVTPSPRIMTPLPSRVIALPQAPGSPLVTLDLIFRKGSVSDPLQASGLTQFTTRALLRGTKKEDGRRAQL
jgi:hypothetical protein